MKGQSITEYAIVLALVFIVLCCVGTIATLFWPAVFAGFLAIFWHPISTWFTGMIAGVQAGDPGSIAQAVVIFLVIIFIIARPRVRYYRS